MPESGLQKAITAAEKNIEDNSGGPFGACLSIPEQEDFIGANHVVDDVDVTSHAEVNVIRNFIRRKGYSFLSEEEKAHLYSSCECCPMCLAMAATVGVRAVTYANTRKDAESIGFADNRQYKLLRRNPIDKIIFAEEAEEILNYNQADFLIFGANDDLITASIQGNPEDLGLASVAGIRKACMALQKFWLPEGCYIISRKIPHPMGLIASDWARVLRPNNESQIVPYQIICADKEYEMPVLIDKNGVGIVVDNAALIYDMIAGKENPAMPVRRTEDKKMRAQALETFQKFAKKVKSQEADVY